MQQLRSALEQTSSHGLPRMVTNKPIFVRAAWLVFFLITLSLFLKGFVGFISKLQADQVTNTLEVGALDFKFPDIYACFENPVSGSYAANIDAKSANAINAHLASISETIRRKIKLVLKDESISTEEEEAGFSFAKVQSIPYNLLVDALAHRAEQSVINSDLSYNNLYGRPMYEEVGTESFYHPGFLRCLKWCLTEKQMSKMLQTGSSAGLVLTLLIDGSDSAVATNDTNVLSTVYAGGTPIPVFDWSLVVSDYNDPDRRAGVRVFITPPGEYPSDYVTSFSLGPGKYHTVEISMMQRVFKEEQFDCVSDEPNVQFVNPYDQTPYNHTYSYSYCYYYEYHRLFQRMYNTSGVIGPLPYLLRGPKYVLNLTGEPTFFNFLLDPSLEEPAGKFDQLKSICASRCPCSTLDYDVSISNADWPTQSSLAPFISSAVKQAWMSAKAKDLSVPALDLLLTGNASSVASYVRGNMLKVHFKPHSVISDQVTFSKDYTTLSFISDVGGILGVYLGMSLLTLCELFELTFDLIAHYKARNKKTNSSMELEAEAMEVNS